MAKNILYIGNKLHAHGRTATTIDTLAPLLLQSGYNVRCASDKLHVVLRFCDMILKTIHLRTWSDYVLIDTYSTKNFWYAITVGCVCNVFKIKYIPILHGGNLPKRLQSHEKLLKAYLNNAHAVVSPSDYLKFAFAKAIPKTITCIPNNIPLDKYPFLSRSSVQPKLLWVRSFTTIYNPLLALKVLELLLKDYPAASLTMVGPDKDGTLATCKAYASTHGLPVTFTGLLSKDAWIVASRGHDIFINTSNFDNLPISVIEAMALGLPVVTTSVGGIPFLINHGYNGMLVPPDIAGSMADAILELLKNQYLAKSLSENGRKTAAVYDWEMIQPLWQALLT